MSSDLLRWFILTLNIFNLVPVMLLVIMLVQERRLIKEKQRKTLNILLVLLIATIGIRSILQVVTYSMRIMDMGLDQNTINWTTLCNTVLMTVTSWSFFLFVNHLNRPQ